MAPQDFVGGAVPAREDRSAALVRTVPADRRPTMVATRSGQLEQRCAYWTQNFDRRPSNYLDAVHGFVATVIPLSRGRHLLTKEKWNAWQECIVNTVPAHGGSRGCSCELATTVGPNARRKQEAPAVLPWRARLCHLPVRRHGMRISKACFSLPVKRSGQPVLYGRVELVPWYCRNAYAFLKLYRRTNDPRWLHRARAFAMHAIGQADAEARLRGQFRYSLWTGDLASGVSLDCVVGQARFPTLMFSMQLAEGLTPRTSRPA